ncbi:MAG: HPr family phosphocarrier protein [Porticoccaceae bacterium]|jgi:phosphocarrier protein HPr
MISRTLPIINELGLHARAATKLASLAGRYECSIKTGVKAPLVDAKSIMSLLLLAASQGTELIFEFDGPDEDEACMMITRLLADYFGEGK